MKIKLTIIIILFSSILAFSQTKSFNNNFEQEKIKVERTKKIRRVTKVAIGVIICTLFQIPAIPVVAAFAITEIISDKNNTNEKQS